MLFFLQVIYLYKRFKTLEINLKTYLNQQETLESKEKTIKILNKIEKNIINKVEKIMRVLNSIGK